MLDEPPIHIRSARLEDADRLAALANQLGYPVSIEALAGQLEAVLADESQAVRVAEVGGRPEGWIQVGVVRSLVEDPHAEIRALIVDTGRRRQGLGRRLVEAAEQWTRQRGLPVLRVRSNVIREEAHPFYTALDFSRQKTSHTYRKRLS